MLMFTDLNKDIKMIFEKMFESEDLIRCVSINSPNYLDDNKSVPNIEDLMYKQIMPYRLMTDSVEENKTFIAFICREFYKSRSGLIKDGYLEFHTYVHKDNMVTNEGLRQYMLAYYIDEIYNDTEFEGVGKIQFESYDELPSPFPNTYTYQIIRYKISYFNR